MYAYPVYKMHLKWKYIHVCLDLSHIISGHFFVHFSISILGEPQHFSYANKQKRY